MQHRNINFPAPKLWDGIKTERPNNTVTTSNGGKEYRINRYSKGRRVVTIAAKNVSHAEFATLQAFYEDVGQGRDSFVWTHPGTGESFNVRFSSGLTGEETGFKSSGGAAIVKLDTITLIEVFV